MKKLLSSLLAIVFVVGVCFSAPVMANAQDAEEGFALENIDKTELEIIDEEQGFCYLNGEVNEIPENTTRLIIKSKITVPAMEDYSVQGILKLTGANIEGVTESAISGSVTTIAEDAFVALTNLQYIFYEGTEENLEIISDDNEDVNLFDEYFIHYNSQRHDIEDAIVSVDSPTCDEVGYTYHKCAVCEYVFDKEEIDALGHTESYVLEKTPTCKETGLMKIICTVCGETVRTVTVAKTENHVSEWVVEKEATCTENGVEVFKCTVCDKITDTREIIAQHKEKIIINKEAGCKTGDEGSKTIVCEICKEELRTETIPLKAHEPKDSWEFVTDSTCSETGSLVKKCKKCGEIVDEVSVPKKEHDFTEWEETKAPGCEEIGEEKRECKNCGETETREVEVLGHDFSEEFTIDVEPTCTEVGSKSKHCIRCEEKFEITEIEATGHIDFVFETIKEATCTTAGSMLKKCKCGEELEIIVTSPKEHILSDWIIDKEATCTTAGSKHKECTLCKAVLESGVIDILGHKYGEWTVTKDATCEEDGSKYRICSVCEDKETVVISKIAHKNAEIKDQQDATCLEDGYSGDMYCPDCETIIEEGEVLKATGHTASDWITDKEATFTEVGSQYKECIVCKVELQTAVIEKLTLDTPKVTIENVSNGIKVKWTQDEDAASYIVYSSQYNAKTKKWSTWTNRGTLKAETSSWVDKKVKQGETYKYTVRAINGKFKSAYEGSAGLRFIETPKATISISTTGLLVKWNKIEGADSYIIYRSEIKDGKWSNWITLGKTGEAKNSWLDDKTVSGVTYRYAIRAVDGKIRSGYIASASMVYLEQPTLKISNSSTGVTGTWQKVDGAKGYAIYRSELVNGKWTNWINLGTAKETSKSFTDKTVKSGSQYKYTLRAVNGAVKSTYKDSNILMYLAEPTIKIKNENNAISGNWNQVKGAKGYIIYRSEMKDGEWTNWVNLGTAKETAKSFTDKTVKCGVTYKYTVRAMNGKYKSSYTDSANLVFLSVPSVKSTNDATGVKVNWNKITGATSYIVYRRELNASKWTTWKNLGSVENNSFIDTTAVSNTKYQYAVRAASGVSKSLYKASATIHYLEAPTVTLEGDETGIKVSWTKTEGAKEYVIYRAVLGEDGKWSSWQNMGALKATKISWIDKSTGEDVVYRYTVRAINGKIKSAYVASEPLMIESEKEPETEQPTTEPDTTNAN